MRIQDGEMTSDSHPTAIDRHAFNAAGHVAGVGDLVGISRAALLHSSQHFAEPTSSHVVARQTDRGLLVLDVRDD
jgi:hypothetical protein